MNKLKDMDMEATSTLESIIGLTGIVTSIVALIIYMELVSEAFKKYHGPRSLITGLQALFFPIGTYFYCKSEWESQGNKFKLISALFAVGAVSIVICKLL
jgi:hypothetical protein